MVDLRLKFGSNLVDFWLNFSRILVEFWLNFIQILREISSVFDSILFQFWLIYGLNLVRIWWIFGWILVEFWWVSVSIEIEFFLRKFVRIMVKFWMIFRLILVEFWLIFNQFPSIFGAIFGSNLLKFGHNWKRWKIGHHRQNCGQFSIQFQLNFASLHFCDPQHWKNWRFSPILTKLSFSFGTNFHSIFFLCLLIWFWFNFWWNSDEFRTISVDDVDGWHFRRRKLGHLAPFCSRPIKTAVFHHWNRPETETEAVKKNKKIKNKQPITT